MIYKESYKRLEQYKSEIQNLCEQNNLFNLHVVLPVNGVKTSSINEIDLIASIKNQESSNDIIDFTKIEIAKALGCSKVSLCYVEKLEDSIRRMPSSFTERLENVRDSAIPLNKIDFSRSLVDQLEEQLENTKIQKGIKDLSISQDAKYNSANMVDKLELERNKPKVKSVFVSWMMSYFSKVNKYMAFVKF